eukprot:m.7585 g.7585  ORF g.7585 m.7585 type:complete len:1082 (-) comp3739_c0_seq1:41-3286(-)
MKPDEVFEGRIVWAKMPSFPEWPAMVIKDKTQFIRKKQTGKFQCHVQFFGEKLETAWVSAELVKEWNLSEGPQQLNYSLEKNFQEAVKQAEDAHKLNIADRFTKFGVGTDCELEKILDHEVKPNGDVQYLCRWAPPYTEKDDSWEPIFHLPPFMLDKYNQDRASRKRKRTQQPLDIEKKSESYHDMGEIPAKTPFDNMEVIPVSETEDSLAVNAAENDRAQCTLCMDYGCELVCHVCGKNVHKSCLTVGEREELRFQQSSYWSCGNCREASKMESETDHILEHEYSPKKPRFDGSNKKKKKDARKVCNMCDEMNSRKKTIACAQCGNTWHLRCIGLGRTPNKDWFCDVCAHENQKDGVTPATIFSDKNQAIIDANKHIKKPTTTMKEKKGSTLGSKEKKGTGVKVTNFDTEKLRPAHKGKKVSRTKTESDTPIPSSSISTEKQDANRKRISNKEVKVRRLEKEDIDIVSTLKEGDAQDQISAKSSDSSEFEDLENKDLIVKYIQTIKLFGKEVFKEFNDLLGAYQEAEVEDEDAALSTVAEGLLKLFTPIGPMRDELLDDFKACLAKNKRVKFSEAIKKATRQKPQDILSCNLAMLWDGVQNIDEFNSNKESERSNGKTENREDITLKVPMKSVGISASVSTCSVSTQTAEEQLQTNPEEVQVENHDAAVVDMSQYKDIIINVNDSIEKIKGLFGDGVSTVILSAVDCVTQKRIGNCPGLGVNCKHAQIFDVEKFIIQEPEYGGMRKCPVCRQVILANEIRIDSLWQRILSNLPKSTKTFKITPDLKVAAASRLGSNVDNSQPEPLALVKLRNRKQTPGDMLSLLKVLEYVEKNDKDSDAPTGIVASSTPPGYPSTSSERISPDLDTDEERPLLDTLQNPSLNAIRNTDSQSMNEVRLNGVSQSMSSRRAEFSGRAQPTRRENTSVNQHVNTRRCSSRGLRITRTEASGGSSRESRYYGPNSSERNVSTSRRRSPEPSRYRAEHDRQRYHRYDDSSNSNYEQRRIYRDNESVSGMSQGRGQHHRRGTPGTRQNFSGPLLRNPNMPPPPLPPSGGRGSLPTMLGNRWVPPPPPHIRHTNMRR